MLGDALIGFTGFVGQNLNTVPFAALFNSKNIEEIRNRRFEMIICAGAPGAKWLANKEPDADSAQIQRLIEVLKTVSAQKFILISTIDVFRIPINADEASVVDTKDLHPYGLHRYALERFVQNQFDSHVLRLPGLFGKGLKKNVIFDFLTNNAVENIESRNVFQFYNLAHIWTDIHKVVESNIPLIHLSTEPTSVEEVVRAGFQKEFVNHHTKPLIRYDFRSKYDSLWDGRNGYLYSKECVLSDLEKFVKDIRANSKV